MVPNSIHKSMHGSPGAVARVLWWGQTCHLHVGPPTQCWGGMGEAAGACPLSGPWAMLARQHSFATTGGQFLTSV